MGLAVRIASGRLEALSRRWKKKIPAIQCLVINKHTGLPSNGVGWFIRGEVDFKPDEGSPRFLVGR